MFTKMIHSRRSHTVYLIIRLATVAVCMGVALTLYLSVRMGKVAKAALPLGTNGKLAFVKYSAGPFVPQTEIYVMNPDGTSQTDLGNGTSPAWSPDGTKIVFEKGSSYDDTNIYVMNADRSGLKQLTFIEPGDVNAHQPA